MKKMELHPNKKLVLKNVILKEIRDSPLHDWDLRIDEFHQFLDKQRPQTFGPVVIATLGSRIEGDQLTQNYDLMVQAHDYKKFGFTNKIAERFERSNCVYLRFEGHPDDMAFANSKLDLYFYENELTSDGSEYSIVLEETENHTVIDFFRPVKAT